MAWNDEVVKSSASSTPQGTFAIAGSDGVNTQLVSVDSSGALAVSNNGAVSSSVSDFISTSSAVLRAANASRNLLTVFNQGPGTLYVVYGVSPASITNYSVRLSPGDYLEVDKYTGELKAIFDSPGTAKVTEIS